MSRFASRKQEVAARFSQAAPQYAAHAQVQQRAADHLLSLAQLQGQVLDLGCGSGREAHLLAAQSAVQQVLAMDLAEGMLQQVPEAERLALCVGDAENLPLATQALDGVFSNFALQWCESRERLCVELKRVLKPGGSLAFSVPGPRSLETLRLNGLLHINAFAGAEAWCEALRRAGFSNVAWQGEMLCDHMADAAELLRAMKKIGANTRDQQGGGGLKGRAWLAEIHALLERLREPEGLPLRYEVLYFTAES